MERDVVWAWCDRPGLDHVVVRETAAAVTADGLAVLELDGASLQLAYEVRCTAHWQFQEATIALRGRGEERQVRLARDAAGRWTVNDQARDDLAPCADIDIMGSPFTNTLPIRRIVMAVAQPVPLTMAYVRLPDLNVVPMAQVYTRLDSAHPPRRFSYRGVDSGFHAELMVDEQGLVMDYPPYWRRRSSSSAHSPSAFTPAQKR